MSFAMHCMSKISGITSGTVGTQTSHAHGSHKCTADRSGIPLFYLIKVKGNGVVYESQASDVTNIYVKGSAASVAFDVLLFW